jgi:hypothetical protein
MPPDLQTDGPIVDYLLKEVSFSTCDNKFFGELEKEMLIPNNVNIHGRLRVRGSLKNYKVRVEFPDETVIAYVKRPAQNAVEGTKRVLTYNLEQLINFEDYWWFPLQDETEFFLGLNLLPPFPNLNPLDLQISCRPDVAIGLQADVTTSIRIQADEHIDNFFARLNASMRTPPGLGVMITQFSENHLQEPTSTVTVPPLEYPFPRISLDPGQSHEYKVTTRITSDPNSMNFLRCQQEILNAKIVTLSDSNPSGPPCNVIVLDNNGREIPVARTVRSTVLQASAQIMYSPFSVRRETRSERQEKPMLAPAI